MGGPKGTRKFTQGDSPCRTSLSPSLLHYIRMKKNDFIRIYSTPLRSMTKSPTFHLNAVDLNLLDDNAFRNSPWCSSSGIGGAA